MNPVVKRIYQKIASDHNLSVAQVKEIVEQQFEFVRKVMAEGEKNKPETFKTIQLTHLGKFAVRKYKLEEFKKKNNGSKD